MSQFYMEHDNILLIKSVLIFHMTKKIKIGGATLEINVDFEAPSLFSFLDKLPVSDGDEVDGKIFFLQSPDRNISIKEGEKKLIVSGPDLDKLGDSLVEIMIIQVIFRFAHFVAQDKPFLLLHGSTVLWEDGKSIVFGDNGKNIGKTTAMVSVALKTKKFISDEFSFYDVEKNKIIGYDFLPIHLRKENIEIFNSQYKLNLGDKELINSSEINIENVDENNLSMVVYPEYSETKEPQVRKLLATESLENLQVLSFSHLAKLINPQMDRMSWLNQKDDGEVIDLTSLCKSLATDRKNFTTQILQKVSSYSIIYNNPSQIYDLVEKAVSQEKDSIVNHVSASAVVYFQNADSIDILLLKKKKGDWVLPKGHIDEGEEPGEAALREAKEEGGLQEGVVEDHLMDDSYSWSPDYGFSTHSKIVKFFLIKGISIQNNALGYEGFEESSLVPAEEAIKIATFDTQKEAIRKALDFIKKKNGTK